MYKYIAVALLLVGLTVSVWSQQTDNASTPESTTRSDGAQEGSDNFDGEDSFTPTEEIKTDSAVSFPVDI